MEQHKSWIFQALHQQYNLRGQLSLGKNIPWKVTRFREEIQIGDTVFFWQAKGNFKEDVRGIYGLGKVISPPTFQEEESKEENKNVYRADINVEEVWFPFLSLDEIKAKSELKNLSILKSDQGTNFRVTENERKFLLSIKNSKKTKIDDSKENEIENKKVEFIDFNIVKTDADPDDTQFNLIAIDLNGEKVKFTLYPSTNEILHEMVSMTLTPSKAGFRITSSKLMAALINYAFKLPSEKIKKNSTSNVTTQTADLLANHLKGKEKKCIALVEKYIGHPIEILQYPSPEQIISTFSKTSSSPNFGSIILNSLMLAHLEGSPNSLSYDHLLKAILNFKTTNENFCKGVHQFLESVNIDVETLQKEVNQIVLSKTNKNPTSNNLITRILPYNADGIDKKKNKDLLDRRSKAVTLATIMAAKAIDPPLAIGLFGNWGAGKSFFIQQLISEVNSIKEEVKNSDKTPKEIQFYKDIAQIEFNAWHYSEGDLWASLVDHIFTELRNWIKKTDKQGGNEKLTNLLNRLDTQVEFRNQASDRKEKIQEKIDEENKNIKAANKNLEQNLEKLAQGRAKNIWVELNNIEISRNIIGTLNEVEVEKVGYPNIQNNVENLLNAAEDLKGLYGRTRGILKALQKTNLEEWNLLWLVFAIILGVTSFPIFSFWISNSSNAFTNYIKGLGEVLGAIIVLSTGVIAWLNKAIGKAQPVIDSANSIMDQIQKGGAEAQKYVDSAKEKQEQEILDLENKIVQYQQEKEFAYQEQKIAENELKEIEKEFLNTRPENRLATFIEERANSQDYRQKLGILALIRRDFEKLSELLILQNQHSESPEDNEILERLKETLGANSDADLDQALAGLPKIERIILYIDDLDRCPPEKVVKVLQAVHLLLAFDLFVVVVAVDSRWVRASLEEQHPKLLLHQTSQVKINDNQEEPQTTVSTTAIDYLEKIFQIPYWVPPLKKGEKIEFAEKLLKGQIEVTPSDIPTPAPEDDNVRPSAKNLVKEPDSDIKHDEDKNFFTVSEDPDTRIKSVDQRIELEPAILIPKKLDLNPQSLKLTEGERDTLLAVTYIAGQNPRQIKRFINIYRLIKVGFGEAEMNKFLGIGGQLPDYEPIALMLALSIGYPKESIEFFKFIELADLDKTLNYYLKKNLLSLNESTRNLDILDVTKKKDHLKFMYSKTLKGLPDNIINLKISRLKENLNTVLRYSIEGQLEKNSHS